MGIQAAFAQSRRLGDGIHAAGVVTFLCKALGRNANYGLSGLLPLENLFVGYSFNHGYRHYRKIKISIPTGW